MVFQGAQHGHAHRRGRAVAAGELEPGETAVLICFENTWAAPFATAVRRNGGQLLAFQRVEAQDLIDSIQALDAADAAS